LNQSLYCSICAIVTSDDDVGYGNSKHNNIKTITTTKTSTLFRTKQREICERNKV
jgi:hypothetical protein